jgi:magnesium-transporting ATPase (P-type)
MALIVEGDSLAHILCDPESTSKFLNLVDRCATVICCRMTPQQKADMVVSVKRQLRKFTLAIGDGGNDVKMI